MIHHYVEEFGLWSSALINAYLLAVGFVLAMSRLLRSPINWSDAFGLGTDVLCLAAGPIVFLFVAYVPAHDTGWVALAERMFLYAAGIAVTIVGCLSIWLVNREKWAKLFRH